MCRQKTAICLSQAAWALTQHSPSLTPLLRRVLHQTWSQPREVEALTPKSQEGNPGLCHLQMVTQIWTQVCLAPGRVPLGQAGLCLPAGAGEARNRPGTAHFAVPGEGVCAGEL